MPSVNHGGSPAFTWRQFYLFRNRTIRVLREYGSAGPMGEVDLSAEGDEPEFDSKVVEEPDFFVVDDRYNEHDRLSIVECDVKYITKGLIESLDQMAKEFPGWWISFSLGDCGLRISAETLLIGGRRFWDCTTVEQVANRCRQPVEFGPETPFDENMYPLWVDIIAGGYRISSDDANPTERQWVEALQTLDDMLSKKASGKLSSFDYDNIKNDLHPKTRYQLITRLFCDIDSLTSSYLKQARRNILSEAAVALSSIAHEGELEQHVERMARVQHVASEKLEPKEFVFWWAEVLHSAREVSALAKLHIDARLRVLLTDPNPLIQMSAVFGLAHLKVSDISSVVGNAMAANEHWLENEVLTKWLLKLRTGSTSYPLGKLF